MAEERRIIVIDDDLDFLNYVSIVLSANGYQVTTASSEKEGLELIRRDPPDLVIVDLMMSYVLDGWSVSREMAADPQLCGIPVMMVSAIVSSEDDAYFPDPQVCRMDAFMSKPLEPKALLARVAELV